ncbi:hypothetical protein FZC80_19055 [Rossellomorea aquimaris]|uniref:Uncharacterized protein n=1 Tax=Rossellomorea aquimaris TaxID=189382 RepID=A0A5D4TFT1_9BACI|nr:hypothetical protein FZC80_19055 [Rossellomorea aquimaris]
MPPNKKDYEAFLIFLYSNKINKEFPISKHNKSASALSSSDRHMFQREKKAGFPFILFGLFDPEGLGAAAGRNKSGSALISLDRHMFQREKKAGYCFYVYKQRKTSVYIHWFFSLFLPIIY